MSQPLKKLFSHHFQADIWRIELDIVMQQLGLEIRDGEAMEVSFALIDLTPPKLLWEDLSFDAGWWTGLAGIHQGTMLLYTYEDQQNPELKNVFALDMQSQEVSWAYSGYNHLAFYQDYSLGFSKQEEERSYARIELPTGELRMLSDAQGQELLQKGKNSLSKSLERCHFPAFYDAGNAYFKSVQTFLASRYNCLAVRGCEYFEIFDKIIISYYTAKQEKLSNFILVCNTEGDLLLHEAIRKEGEGLARDTFFIIGRKLIFTKEKRIIECYEI